MRSNKRLDVAIQRISRDINESALGFEHPDIRRCFDILNALQWARGLRRGVRYPEVAVYQLTHDVKRGEDA